MAQVAANAPDLLSLAKELLVQFAAIDWAVVIKEGTHECIGLLSSVGQLPAKAKAAAKNIKDKAAEAAANAYDGLNRFNICYYLGFAFTWVISVGFVAKALGKAGKAGEVLVKVFKFLDDLAATMLGPALKVAGSVLEKFMGLIRGLIAFLKRGTEAVTKALTEFFERLKKWLDGAGVKAVDDKVDDIVLTEDQLKRKKEIEKIESKKENFRGGSNRKGKERHPNDRTREGNYGGMKSIDDFETHRWLINGNEGNFTCISKHAPTSLDDFTKKGIDGIFVFSNPKDPPPPFKYYIDEAKYGKGKLDTTPDRSGNKQMEKDWIWSRLADEMPEEIYKDIEKYGFQPMLTHVSDDFIITRKLLDENAKVIGEFNGKRL